MCASKPALLLVGFLVGLLLATGAHAADREQEQIRRLRQQLQQLQGERSSQQQAAQQATAEAVALKRELDALKDGHERQQARLAGQAREAREAAAEHDAERVQLLLERNELKRKLAATRRGAAQLLGDLGEREHEKNQLAAGLGSLQPRHASQAAGLQACVAANEQLHGIGLELLDRYQNKGLWSALRDQEPLLQVQRVKLENLMQGYRERLDAQALAPAGAAARP